jgi:hypothetical protein
MLFLSGLLFQPDRGNPAVRLLGGRGGDVVRLLDGNLTGAPPCYPTIGPELSRTCGYRRANPTPAANPMRTIAGPATRCVAGSSNSDEPDQGACAKTSRRKSGDIAVMEGSAPRRR